MFQRCAAPIDAGGRHRWQKVVANLIHTWTTRDSHGMHRVITLGYTAWLCWVLPLWHLSFSSSVTLFSFALCSESHRHREFVHLLVLDQGLNCAHGINNLVCLPTVFFVGFFGQDSGGLWRAHLSQGWFWQCWTRGAVLTVETMNPWPKLVFQEDSFRVCSQMEQMFTSSFHVNFWHFALVILTTKSGNGEVYGKEKLNLLNFFHILLSSFEAVGLPKLLPFSCLFSSVSTLPSVESSLLESFPPLLSWLTRVMMTSWNIFFSIWDKWDSMYWQGQVRREKWSLSLMY